MSIEPINNISFSFIGNISKKHQKIISELIMLGIQPSYNYEIDKAKLSSAKSKKIAKTSQRDNIKEEDRVNIKNNINTGGLQYGRTNSGKEADYEFLGASYISSINKFYKIKNMY